MKLTVRHLGGVETVQGTRVLFEHGALIVKNNDVLVKAWAPGRWFTIELQEVQ